MLIITEVDVSTPSFFPTQIQARTIYYPGLPWLIGKALFKKQVYVVKQRLGITKENAEQREAEVTVLSLMIFFCNLLISNLRTYSSVRNHAPVE